MLLLFDLSIDCKLRLGYKLTEGSPFWKWVRFEADKDKETLGKVKDTLLFLTLAFYLYSLHRFHHLQPLLLTNFMTIAKNLYPHIDSHPSYDHNSQKHLIFLLSYFSCHLKRPINIFWEWNLIPLIDKRDYHPYIYKVNK